MIARLITPCGERECMQEKPDDAAFSSLLSEVQGLITGGLDEKKTGEILNTIGIPAPSGQMLSQMRLFSEYLPMAREYPFTAEQRYLHFLWEAVDHSPMSLAVNFSIPFRRMIAKKLFRRCGKNFCCENGVRFNFGQFIEIGDDVFINEGTFIDSKGGVVIGNAVGISEFVRIMTHTHSESNHTDRIYGRVVIGDYARISLGSTIFHGIKIGEEAIVASCSVVTRDVPARHVVAGVPAEVVHERHSGGRHRDQLNHIWLAGAAFQDE